MAETSIGPRLQVTGEKEFKAAMAGINNEFKLLTSEMKVSLSQFDRNDKSTQALTAQNEVLGKQMDTQKSKIALLTTQYDNQNTKLTTLRTSLDATKAAFAADSAEVAQAQRAYDRQNTAVMGLQTQLNGATTGLNNMNRALEDNNQTINENARDMGEFGETVKGMGKALVAGILAIGAAFVGATVAGVKMADDLTKSLNGLQSATGTSDVGMGEMRQTMLAIYNDNFGEDFEDIGAALTTVSQATGLTGDALKKATENALLLRDTFQMDVQESVVSTDMLMTKFGMTSEQAYNLLAQGAQNGLNKNGDMLDSINEYSGLYKEAGFSAEEMFNMFSNGAKAGVQNTDKVADSFKEFSIRTKDGSKTTQDAFKSLGLDVDKIGKAFNKGGAEGKAAFELVNKKLAETKDETERNRIGVELYGTQWEDSGAKGVLASTNTKGAVDSTTDSLKKINEVKYNTFGESVEGIKRQLLTGIVLPLGEQVLPKMNEFATNIKTNMPAIQNEIKFAFSSIGTAIKEAATAIGGIIDWFVKYKAIVTPIAAAVAAVIVNAWLVTAISATKTAIINGIASAKVIADWLLMGIKSTFHALVVVGSWVATASGAVASVIVHVAQAAIVVAKWLWMGVQSGIHALKVVASWVVTSAGAIAAGLVMIAQSAVVVAKWVWMGVQSTIQAAKMAAAWVIAMGPIAWVAIAVAGIAVLIAANWDKVKAKTIEIFTSVSTWLSTKWTEIKTSAVQTFESMKNAISGKVSSIKDTIVTGITKAVTWIKKLPGEALTWGKDFIQGFVDGITSKAKALLESVRRIAEKIRGLLGHSTPTDGPMAHDDMWMPDFMDNLAKGIDANKFKVTNAIQGLSADMTMGVRYNALPNATGISQDMVLKTAQEVARSVITSMQTQTQPAESSQPIQINLHMDGKVISQQLFNIQRGRTRGKAVTA